MRYLLLLVSMLFVAGFFSCTEKRQASKEADKYEPIYQSEIQKLKKIKYRQKNLGKSVTLDDYMDTTLEIKLNNPALEDSTAELDSEFDIATGSTYVYGKKLGRSFGNLIFTDVLEIEKSTVSTKIEEQFFYFPFLNCRFDSTVIITRDTIVNGLLFNNCMFKLPYYYHSNQYKGFPMSGNVGDYGNVKLANFENMFTDCIFENGLNYNSKATFNEEVSGDWQLLKLVSPSYSDTLGSIIFSHCILKGKLDLSECAFKPGASLAFKRTNLPDTLDLSKTKFYEPLDLTTAYPCYSGGKCFINLLNADIDKITMQYENFKLYVPDTIRKDPRAQDIVNNQYQLLLNHFQKNGFAKSYRQLDIEYKEWQSDDNSLLKLSNLWWRFGYEKWRIIPITLGLILVFALLNFLAYDKLHVVYNVEKLRIDKTQRKPSLYFAFNKFTAAIVYTCIIFFRFTLDLKNLQLKPMGTVCWIILQYITGLICTAFILNWVLKF